MSAATSPGTGLAYGLRRVCAAWGMARSSFYAMTSGQHAEQPPAKRRGPKPAISDQALLVAIEADLEASTWARGPQAGAPPDGENNLLSPHRAAAVAADGDRSLMPQGRGLRWRSGLSRHPGCPKRVIAIAPLGIRGDRSSPPCSRSSGAPMAYGFWILRARPPSICRTWHSKRGSGASKRSSMGLATGVYERFKGGSANHGSVRDLSTHNATRLVSRRYKPLKGPPRFTAGTAVQRRHIANRDEQDSSRFVVRSSAGQAGLAIARARGRACQTVMSCTQCSSVLGHRLGPRRFGIIGHGSQGLAVVDVQCPPLALNQARLG